MDIEPIFRCKTQNAEKLAAYGFTPDGERVAKNVPILQGMFSVAVTVEPDSTVRFKVLECATGEEYMLVQVDSARGGFVGDVRKACETVLLDIAAKCFDTELLKAGQTKRVLAYMNSAFSAEPEFLWKSYPAYAVFRRPDNRKWFAVLLTVDRSSLGAGSSGAVEILDLKARPAEVEAHLADPRFFRAYHMNKTHWFTVCLDGSVSDETLFSLIAESRRQAK